jgi:hypothetical protein
VEWRSILTLLNSYKTLILEFLVSPYFVVGYNLHDFFPPVNNIGIAFEIPDVVHERSADVRNPGIISDRWLTFLPLLFF